MSASNPIMPSIGRIVLFSSVHQDGELPAIVTKVHSQDCINVTVFPDGGIPFPMSSVQYAEDHAASGLSNSFHWMDYQLKVAAERDPVTGEASAS